MQRIYETTDKGSEYFSKNMKVLAWKITPNIRIDPQISKLIIEF